MKVLPCPICEKEVQVIYDHPGRYSMLDEVWRISCDLCELRVYASDSEAKNTRWSGEDLAIQKWNEMVLELPVVVRCVMKKERDDRIEENRVKRVAARRKYVQSRIEQLHLELNGLKRELNEA